MDNSTAPQDDGFSPMYGQPFGSPKGKNDDKPTQSSQGSDPTKDEVKIEKSTVKIPTQPTSIPQEKPSEEISTEPISTYEEQDKPIDKTVEAPELTNIEPNTEKISIKEEPDITEEPLVPETIPVQNFEVPPISPVSTPNPLPNTDDTPTTPQNANNDIQQTDNTKNQQSTTDTAVQKITGESADQSIPTATPSDQTLAQGASNQSTPVQDNTTGLSDITTPPTEPPTIDSVNTLTNDQQTTDDTSQPTQIDDEPQSIEQALGLDKLTPEEPSKTKVPEPTPVQLPTDPEEEFAKEIKKTESTPVPDTNETLEETSEQIIETEDSKPSIREKLEGDLSTTQKPSPEITSSIIEQEPTTTQTPIQPEPTTLEEPVQTVGPEEIPVPQTEIPQETGLPDLTATEPQNEIPSVPQTETEQTAETPIDLNTSVATPQGLPPKKENNKSPQTATTSKKSEKKLSTLNKTLKFATILGVLLLVGALVLISIPSLPYIWYKISANATTDETKSISEPATGEDENSFSSVIEPSNQEVALPDLDGTLPYYNTLIIPSIGVEGVIHEGKDPQSALEDGIWRVYDFGTPEDATTTILAAHRFGYLSWTNEFRTQNSFYNLPKTKVGDTIEIIWKQRKYEYKITKEEEGTTISDYDSDLILYTCKLFNTPVRIFRYAERTN